MNAIYRICREALEHLSRHDVHMATRLLRDAIPPQNGPASLAPCRIYTLGRFAIVIDGVAVNFSGKSRRVPLELLKAIIALGGRAVPVQAIYEALWSDLDGDAAYAALKIALHRLRKMLGSASLVRLSNGALTLDETRIWVDAWGFERWFGTCYSQRIEASSFDFESAQKQVRAYRGTFLGADTPAWGVAYRERLQSKFTRSVMLLGHLYERANAWLEAADVYELGIDIDPLAEDLYQRVIVCYSKLGRRGQAIAAYRRCQATLDAQLKMVPMRKTQALYESLRSDEPEAHPVEARTRTPSELPLAAATRVALATHAIAL